MTLPASAESGSARATPAIEARELRKRYGDIDAVDGVSFQVGRGEVFGLLGPNGAGKTTTVEIIEGLREPDAGDAFVDGVSVQDDPRRVKAMIGVQLQHTNFFDLLNLQEIVDLFAVLYESRVSTSELLETVGLLGRRKARCNQLSGGQLKRLSIATALVNDPLAVFLDEPTAGLDPLARRNIWEIVERVAASGKSLVLTTHYMAEAQQLCDRVAMMDGGKIVAIGEPDALVAELAASGVKSVNGDDQLTLEDVFLNLTGRGLQDTDGDDDGDDGDAGR